MGAAKTKSEQIIESFFNDHDFMNFSDEECSRIESSIQDTIEELRESGTEEDEKDAMQLSIYLHGFRDLVDKFYNLNKRYSKIVESGRYYTYFFKDPKERVKGDICLVLDGKPTNYIIPHETIEDLEREMQQYIYDGIGDKYTPLETIVGDRPFLPVNWYFKICIDIKPKKAQNTIVIKSPKQITVMLDKVTQTMNKGEIPFNSDYYTGINTWNNKEKPTGVMLSFDESLLQNITTSRELKSYDMAVLTAVCTCILEGNPFIPIGTIYNVLSGKKTKMHEAQKKEIMESLQKLMSTIIKLDLKNEPLEYGFEKNPILREAMLLGTIAEFAIKGNDVQGFIVKDTPILLRYAQKKKQYKSVPIECFNAPINNTRTSIALKVTIITRILCMERSDISRYINYDNLIEIVTDSIPSSASSKRKQRADIIKKTLTILEHLKKINFISGYKEHMDGTKKISVEITLNPERKKNNKTKRISKQ